MGYIGIYNKPYGGLYNRLQRALRTRDHRKTIPNCNPRYNRSRLRRTHCTHADTTIEPVVQ
eukprot:5661258-Lingulodinium_polyedra.AAC.1